MNEKTKQQFLDLATALEGELPGVFDMRRWLHKGGCSTVACAVGWGIELGLLPGLELEQSETGLYPALLPGETSVIPTVARYFGISNDDAIHLFMMSSYSRYRWDEDFVAKPITKEMVAERLRQYVTDHE